MFSPRLFEWTVAVAVTMAVATADAAVIRLRAEYRGAASIVRLGDVAQIDSADAEEAERLAAIELLPAPAAGRSLQISLRDIQDAMTRRNENPIDHVFSGASHVMVAGATTSVRETTAFLTTSQTRHATDQVRQAIAEYLAAEVEPGHWNVEPELPNQQADAIRSNASAILVTDGRQLEEGRARFDLSLDGADGPLRFSVDATIAHAPAVVVATRPIPRGAKVTATDVELRHAAPPRGDKGTFGNIDEVLGMQVVRAIRAGQVLDDRAVRPVLLVRRRDVVTVYSRAGGVEVRTMARAVDEGGQGELVAVESLTNRKTFFARVSGPQTVEVVAQPIRPVVTSRPVESRSAPTQGALR